MKLCECGCGGEVKSLSVRFLAGHHNRSPEVKKKKKLTSQKNYGTDNPMQSLVVQEQYKSTMIKTHGVDHNFKLESTKKKRQETWIEKYGVPNPNQSDIIKKKKIDTNQKNRKVDNPSQSEDVKQFKINTCQNHFGATHHMKYEPIKTRIVNTCIQGHGGTGFGSKEILQKITDIVQEKFGVDNYSKTSKFREFARDLRIRDISIQRINGELVGLSVGKQERPALDELQTCISYTMLRNRYFKGYFPDGWIKELNLLIEFDEKWHTMKGWIKKDKKKNLDYISYGMNYFRISEKDWKENKEEVIQNLLCVIKGLEDIKRLQDPSTIN